MYDISHRSVTYEVFGRNIGVDGCLAEAANPVMAAVELHLLHPLPL
jgi:hypothetical protein